MILDFPLFFVIAEVKMQRKNKNPDNTHSSRRSLEQRSIKLNDIRLNHSSSPSPIRDNLEYGSNIHDSADLIDPAEIVLKHKWLDNSPRMSKLREHRQKRLINRLEVKKYD